MVSGTNRYLSNTSASLIVSRGFESSFLSFWTEFRKRRGLADVFWRAFLLSEFTWDFIWGNYLPISKFHRNLNFVQLQLDKTLDPRLRQNSDFRKNSKTSPSLRKKSIWWPQFDKINSIFLNLALVTAKPDVLNYSFILYKYIFLAIWLKHR